MRDAQHRSAHNLIVAQMGTSMPAGKAKLRKDLQQAEALIRLLSKTRPGDLLDAWEELKQRGDAWHVKAHRSLQSLDPEVRELLAELLSE